MRSQIYRPSSPHRAALTGAVALALSLSPLAPSLTPRSPAQAKPAAPARSATQGLTLPPAAPMERPSLPPLSEAARAALASIRPDPEPPALVRNSHYWVSNEHNHQVWRAALSDVGGALVGVGTDQNYLLAGWARPELLILMDFDGEIAKLHELYGYLFSISATPEDFLRRWRKAYEGDTRALLRAHLEQRAPAANAERWVASRLKIYTVTRPLIDRRLTRTLAKYQALNTPIFLSDQAQYDHLRGLWAQGRALAIRGDLTANNTMLDIARALRAAGVELNALYVSNAEQYFELTPEYRRNLIEQPWGQRGVLLRTLGWETLGYLDAEEAYHYNVQGGENVRAWMKKGLYKKAGQILRKRTQTEPDGTSEMRELPPEPKRAPQVAPLP
jgi:hypothetical protein